MGTISHILIAGLLATSAQAGKMRPEPDGPIVHLFEWRFDDIAEECVKFLKHHGFGGVQVSPVNENIIISGRPWYERYQPLSYKIASRSGDETAFRKMVKACNNVGIKIYVDVVFNHMCGTHTEHDQGTGGSVANSQNYYYPAVPYTRQDFHDPCEIKDWNNPHQSRYCQVVGLQDLDQSRPNVRQKMIEYLNKLLEIGVAGFRVDAVKHMEPNDVQAIFGGARAVNPSAGFVSGARAYVYQEFFGFNTGELKPSDYYRSGSVTDFKYAFEVTRAFRNENQLKWYKTFGQSWGLIEESKSLVFIDNHDTQRGQFGNAITHKEPRLYKMAVAFMLSWPYGVPQLMSSFKFDNKDAGPPANGDGGSIQRVQFSGDVCTNGWMCEHRWRQIYNMVKFRKVVEKEPVKNWWDNGNYQIAFSRGNKGFIVFNPEQKEIDQQIQTGLPKGTYCDVISGKKEGSACTKSSIHVDDKGMAQITFPTDSEDGVQAYHVGAKL